MPRSTGKAKEGERCSECGKPFAEGERINQYWIRGELHSIMCRNSVACEKRMAEQEDEDKVP